MQKTFPGSDTALDAGCLCPVMDNAHGRGARGTWDKPDNLKQFYTRGDCPMHGKAAKENKEKAK